MRRYVFGYSHMAAKTELLEKSTADNIVLSVAIFRDEGLLVDE
jgi:hypothetical protein